MPAADPDDSGTGQKRCPVCWTPFTPNDPANPYPRRYCCGACRIEDSRRRRRRGDDSSTPAPVAHTEQYRYSPPPPHGPCHVHPHCIITGCARFLCPKLVHVTISQRGQPRRYCSPACRVAEHRRLN